jgi:hypothetical protein
MPTLLGTDSVQVRFDTAAQIAQVRVGRDTLRFDLRLLPAAAESVSARYDMPRELLRLDTASFRRRARLALESANGRRRGKERRFSDWQGWLFLGRPE